MSGPVDSRQDQPLHADDYKHHALLLKSMHCCRQVLYRGLHQYINGLTTNHSGGSIQMTVYLSGVTGGIDASEIQIKPQPGANT